MPSRTKNITGGLALQKLAPGGLWSIQGNRETQLETLVGTVFKAAQQQDAMLRRDNLRLLTPWPHQAYLLSEQLAIPADMAEYTALMTDLSHGFVQLRLAGEFAFAFIAGYVSTDISALQHAGASRRCLLGQYRVILWWDQCHEINLLLERSYAQAFGEYIDILIAGWRPEAHDNIALSPKGHCLRP